MCGIAGGVRHFISEQGRIEVRKRLSHRGPDDNGFYQNGNLWLLNTRLAIQDVSAAGRQPMQTTDGRFTLVFNGEIYNHLELRAELAAFGIQFRSSCDTETLLYAYAIWGTDCLQKLDGDFAFAIWDALKSELFLARDPMGVKPLYFWKAGNSILFASELYALKAAAGTALDLQSAAFYAYLAFQYAPGSLTPFKDVEKLLPGHYLKCNGAGLMAEPTPYYHPTFPAQQHTRKENYVDDLDALLIKSVATQLQSDKPVGFFLSGGLDSSLLVAIARKHCPDASSNAFTIRYAHAQAWDGFAPDYSYAQETATALNVTLHDVQGDLDYATEMDDMIRYLGEPQADPAALHTAHIAATARSMGIEVLISGTGADDIFSGYRRHGVLGYGAYAAGAAAGLNIIPAWMQTRIPAAATVARRLQKLGLAEGTDYSFLAGLHFWMRPKELRSLFQPDHYAAIDNINLERLLFAGESGWQELSKLNTALLAEQLSFLPHHNLAYLDKLCMKHGVEARVPYLDKDIVAFANSLPEDWKLRGPITKYILRRVAKSYLPERIIRRKKTGFGAPLRAWFKDGEGAAFARERLSDRSFTSRHIFRSDAIENLINHAEKGTKDSAYTVFSLLCIESWLRQFAPTQ